MCELGDRMGKTYNRVIVSYTDVFGDGHYYTIKCKNHKETQEKFEEQMHLMERLRREGEVDEYNVTKR